MRNKIALTYMIIMYASWAAIIFYLIYSILILHESIWEVNDSVRLLFKYSSPGIVISFIIACLLEDKTKKKVNDLWDIKLFNTTPMVICIASPGLMFLPIAIVLQSLEASFCSILLFVTLVNLTWRCVELYYAFVYDLSEVTPPKDVQDPYAWAKAIIQVYPDANKHIRKSILESI